MLDTIRHPTQNRITVCYTVVVMKIQNIARWLVRKHLAHACEVTM